MPRAFRSAAARRSQKIPRGPAKAEAAEAASARPVAAQPEPGSLAWEGEAAQPRKYSCASLRIQACEVYPAHQCEDRAPARRAVRISYSRQTPPKGRVPPFD